MTTRYTMDAQDLYDGDRPLRDTDICARLNEQDDELTTARAQLAAYAALHQRQRAALAEAAEAEAAGHHLVALAAIKRGLGEGKE